MASKTLRGAFPLFTIVLLIVTWLFWQPLFADDPAHAKVSVHFQTTTVRPGSEVEGIIQMSLDPDWHLYWKNPGETGLAPSFTWTLPPGVTIKEVLWPAPTLIHSGSNLFYGYEKNPKWIVRLAFDEKIEETALSVSLNVFWISCNGSCEPSNQQVTKTFAISKNAPPVPQNDATIIQAKELIPIPLASAHVIVDREKFSIQLLIPNKAVEPLSSVIFFPEVQGLFSVDMLPSFQQQGENLTLILHFSRDGEKILQQTGRLQGVVQLLFKNNQPSSYSIDVPLESPRITTTPAGWIEPNVEKAKCIFGIDKYFCTILILAFAGGILLNFMPCVLPVIGLKMLQLVSLRGMKKTFLHGLLFTFGILFAFWVLAGILYSFERVGSEFGWGFQLQQPLFISALILVLFALAMNLFGLFEMGITVSQIAAQAEETHKGPSYFSSFASGILATLIATPCTGPLLGSVVGFAATFQPMDGFILFTTIGLGMAFPYLLVSIFPFFLSWIPRPGSWMISLKQFLAFCLLATVLWLLWVLEAEVSTLALLPVCGGFVLLAISLWIVGRWGSFERSSTTRVVAHLISLSIGIASILVFLSSFPSKANTWLSQFIPKYETINWEEFSQDRLDKEIQAGNVVFIQFTAKWCLLCQTNRIIFRSHEVVEAFEQNRIIPLKADWTNGDPHITNMLRSLGRNGVPVYAIFRPGKEPIILPEVVTPDMIVNAIEEASH